MKTYENYYKTLHELQELFNKAHDVNAVKACRTLIKQLSVYTATNTNRIVVTVDKQKKDWTQGWTYDYSTPEDALKAAQEDWDHLTKEEQKNIVIYVYVDEITQEEDEDHNEDRRSWHDGFTPIKTFGGNEE